MSAVEAAAVLKRLSTRFGVCGCGISFLIVDGGGGALVVAVAAIVDVGGGGEVVLEMVKAVRRLLMRLRFRDFLWRWWGV